MRRAATEPTRVPAAKSRSRPGSSKSRESCPRSGLPRPAQSPPRRPRIRPLARQRRDDAPAPAQGTLVFGGAGQEREDYSAGCSRVGNVSGGLHYPCEERNHGFAWSPRTVN